MMDLSEIQQYSHKIIKVSITNTNQKTSYDKVTVKVHLDRETNDTIRFSLTESPTIDEWLPHQAFDNDYFLYQNTMVSKDQVQFYRCKDTLNYEFEFF